MNWYCNSQQILDEILTQSFVSASHNYIYGAAEEAVEVDKDSAGRLRWWDAVQDDQEPILRDSAVLLCREPRFFDQLYLSTKKSVRGRL